MRRPATLVLACAAILAPSGVEAQAAAGHGARDRGGPGSADRPVEGRDFTVWRGDGSSASFAELVAASEVAEAVLVGESHDDAVGHGVEAELLARVAERNGSFEPGGRPLVLSLEMFERDVQYILDEYLAGLITEDQFTRAARPWDRYVTDYRPMVELARAHGLPVIAANAPRRYVNRVTRLGPGSLEELPPSARAFLPPLPYPPASDAYAAEWNALMADMMRSAPSTDTLPDGVSADTAAAAVPPAEGSDREDPAADAETGTSPPRHGMGYALDAQALWDAAMGHAVADALSERPGALVVHYAGSFHVAHGTGIAERVEDYRPGTRVVTVVIEPTEHVHQFDAEAHDGLGDWVILTREPR